jgi:hypothetical protein
MLVTQSLQEVAQSQAVPRQPTDPPKF